VFVTCQFSVESTNPAAIVLRAGFFYLVAGARRFEDPCIEENLHLMKPAGLNLARGVLDFLERPSLAKVPS